MATRDDLVELIDRWFATLPAGDVGALPLSPDIRMTENGADVGPGAWAFRFDHPGPSEANG